MTAIIIICSKQDYKMKVEGAEFWDKITYLCESNNEEDIYSSPQFIIIKASKVMNFVAKQNNFA